MKKVYISALVGIIVFAGVSCTKSPYSYVFDDMEELSFEQKDWAQALETIEAPESRFTAINAIAKNLKAKNKTKTLIYFLTHQISLNEQDPYNAYWLLMVANEYLQAGEKQIAEYYLERIVNTYPDMLIKQQSLHYLCLQNLVKITDNQEKLISYYTLLLNTLYDKINPALAYFSLGQAYEKIGEWKLAIQAYNEFVKLGQYDIIIEGIPDSFNYAKRLVDYSNSTKSWVYESLDELVRTVRIAVREMDFQTLERCMSKVNFVTIAWNQEASNVSSQANFNLRTLMSGGYIRVGENLASFSTNNEAYLYTSGWTQYTNVWYLYFKKVNFPADPEIHGTWEWAGIYYGEKK